jgi:DNA/RNA endonuclease YhcR with UshA esterase domain
MRRVLVALGLAALVAFGSIALSEDRKTIFDSDASRHVGETVSVRGLVAGVYTSKSNTTFINFGAAYPHHTFTAVIFSSAISRFTDPKKWNGKMITVIGLIKDYKGKPEIVLESPSQVSDAGQP